MQNAAMLWTGGKDSAMALYEASRQGYLVRHLITFAPETPDFKAHPLPFIRMQAQALQLPHTILPIQTPYESSYEAGLRVLREEMDIHCVVTGDIAEVNGHPNWIRERSRPVGINVIAPLWGRDRETLLQELLHRRFKTIFSCVDKRWLDESWVGGELDETAVADLRLLCEERSVDICGENGEYHTMVLDGPGFGPGLAIGSCSTKSTGHLAYLEIHELALIDHAG